MKKIILALALICLVLPGCTEQEQQEYNKYSDVSYLLSCYDLQTYEEFCACLGGEMVINRDIRRICSINRTFTDIRLSNQLIQKDEVFK